MGKFFHCLRTHDRSIKWHKKNILNHNELFMDFLQKSTNVYKNTVIFKMSVKKKVSRKTFFNSTNSQAKLVDDTTFIGRDHIFDVNKGIFSTSLFE